MSRLDFITTNFGFGPAAKLVAVARAVRDLHPRIPLRLVASGHALAFGRLSGAFDDHLALDLDGEPERAREVTRGALAVVDSLNFDVLPHLAAAGRRVYLLDSLAWLWPELPAEVEQASVYAVQGYLLDSRRERSEELPHASLKLHPILDPLLVRRGRPVVRDPDLALISLGGCCNPFVSPTDLGNYAVATVRAAVDALRPRFAKLEVHTNAQVAATVAEALADWRIPVRHSSHPDFLDRLARCGLLVTTPGITATLECLALGTPLKFLPSNNYSQYRILEIYAQRRALSADVRFASFSGGVEVGPDEIEEQAVRRIGEALARLRRAEFEAELGERLDTALGADRRFELERLRRQPFALGDGAVDLASEILRAVDGAPDAAPRREPTTAVEPRRPAVESTVARLVARAADVPAATLDSETRLKEDLGVDSMGVLELVGELQRALGCEISSGDMDITDFRTVGRIVSAARRLTGTLEPAEKVVSDAG